MDRQTLVDMFNGLSEQYKQLLVRDNKPLLSQCLSQLGVKIDNGDIITPKVKDIFRAFKMTPYNNIKVVIIGQDPFIRPQQATGLSFSVPKTIQHNGATIKVRIPPSTRKIYQCLEECGEIKSMPAHGNLNVWARQGVLMLNAALTTKIGVSNAHTFWHAYTDKIIQDLSKQKDFIVFILWGGFAADKAKLIDTNKHTILKWGHPSPANLANGSRDNKQNFLYCDNFTRANEELESNGLEPIVWDPDFVDKKHIIDVTADVSAIANAKGDVSAIANAKGDANVNAAATCAYLFTDGGATANGKANCRASWGAYIRITGKNATSHTMSGLVPPVQIGGSKYTASNQRGEILGVAKAIEYIVEKNYTGDVEIVTDSRYTIDCLTKWVPNWIKKDIVKEKKNVDLLIPLYRQIQTMPNDITFKHINSHRKPPPQNTPEYFYWYGNDVADKLCSVVLAA